MSDLPDQPIDPPIPSEAPPAPSPDIDPPAPPTEIPDVDPQPGEGGRTVGSS